MTDAPAHREHAARILSEVPGPRAPGALGGDEDAAVAITHEPNGHAVEPSAAPTGGGEIADVSHAPLECNHDALKSVGHGWSSRR
jgi:hypothetical protein